MSIRKLILSVMLFIIIVISLLSGCGKNGTGGHEETGEFKTAEAGAVEYRYVPKYVSLPADFVQINEICVDKDRLYLAAYQSEQISAERLYEMNTDGTGLTELTGYKAPDLPENCQGYVIVTSMATDYEGSLWVAEYLYYYQLDNMGNATEFGSMPYLRKLDDEGSEILVVDISDLADNSQDFYIYDMEVDNTGNVYISDGYTNAYIFDSLGSRLFSLSSAGIYNIVKMTDGTIAAVIYENGYLIKPIDTASESWGLGIPAENNLIDAHSGSDEYAFLYSESSNLVGYSNENSTYSELLNWLDCDINVNDIISLAPLPNGVIICSLYSQVGNAQSTDLVILNKQPSTSIKEKTILNMACFQLDNTMRSAIIDFNRKNEKHRISVTDYAEYNTKDDASAGITKFNTEIIAGSIPDLILSPGLPVKRYIAKGLFADLYPYLDNDTALGGREKFIPEVLVALETGGSLYQIAPCFMIDTVVGKSDVVGSKSGWTYDELLNLLEEHPEGTQLFANVTSDIALNFMVMYIDQFVNWQTGECSFNDEGFMNFLEFTNMFPKGINYDTAQSEVALLEDGRALLQVAFLSTFEDIQIHREVFNGQVTYKGYPCDEGSGSAFFVYSGIMISSKSENKEGAWEFISSLLTEKYQSGDHMEQFPINRAAFEKYAQRATEGETVVKNGAEEKVPKDYRVVDGLPILVYAASDEDIDIIRELIKNTDRITEYDDEMMKIIREEALPYFNGEKSVEDAATIIQNRITTYVNEQI